MPKIDNLSNLVKIEMSKWESMTFPKNSDYSDKFHYLEHMLSATLGSWYIETKETIKEKGMHELGATLASFKGKIESIASELRMIEFIDGYEDDLDRKDTLKALIPYEAAQLFTYAKSVYRRKTINIR